MDIQLDAHGINVLKTLASTTRVSIIHILSRTPATISEIAKELNLSKAIISRDMRILEDTGIIRLDDESNGDNRKKRFKLAVDHLSIDFPKKIHLPFNETETEIKLGYYSDFFVVPTCGLASEAKIINEVDDPRTFVSNERIDASLLWFADGFVEYVIPNQLPVSAKIELLELSLEISSEFPNSNNNWPSDISFYINNIRIGTLTVPGNYSDVRGALTPSWWDSRFSQYGRLKHIRVTNKDTGIDGKKVSDVTLKELKLSDSPFIKIRIGIEEEAEHKGGLTIFGEHFGNYSQNILLKCFYSNKDKKTDHVLPLETSRS